MLSRIKSLDPGKNFRILESILRTTSYGYRSQDASISIPANSVSHSNSWQRKRNEEERRGGDQIGVATKYNNNQVACLSLSLFLSVLQGTTNRAKAFSRSEEEQSLELSFLSGEKEIRTSGSRVVTWAQGRKVNVFCEASYKTRDNQREGRVSDPCRLVVE